MRLHAQAVAPSDRSAATLHLMTPYYGQAAFFEHRVIHGMSVVSLGDLA